MTMKSLRVLWDWVYLLYSGASVSSLTHSHDHHEPAVPAMCVTKQDLALGLILHMHPYCNKIGIVYIISLSVSIQFNSTTIGTENRQCKSRGKLNSKWSSSWFADDVTPGGPSVSCRAGRVHWMYTHYKLRCVFIGGWRCVPAYHDLMIHFHIFFLLSQYITLKVLKVDTLKHIIIIMLWLLLSYTNHT